MFPDSIRVIVQLTCARSSSIGVSLLPVVVQDLRRLVWLFRRTSSRNWLLDVRPFDQEWIKVVGRLG